MDSKNIIILAYSQKTDSILAGNNFKAVKIAAGKQVNNSSMYNLNDALIKSENAAWIKIAAITNIEITGTNSFVRTNKVANVTGKQIKLWQDIVTITTNNVIPKLEQSNLDYEDWE